VPLGYHAKGSQKSLSLRTKAHTVRPYLSAVILRWAALNLLLEDLRRERPSKTKIRPLSTGRNHRGHPVQPRGVTRLIFPAQLLLWFGEVKYKGEVLPKAKQMAILSTASCSRARFKPSSTDSEPITSQTRHGFGLTIDGPYF